MSKKINIFVPCDEANHICDKGQYKEASFWEKIKLNIHLIYCKACRGYSKKNATLTKVIKKSEVDCLDAKCKENMKKDLEKALKEQLD
jgi:hypothetical protein